MEHKKLTSVSLVLITMGIIIGLVIAAGLNITQISNADPQQEVQGSSSQTNGQNVVSPSSMEILEAMSNAFADVAEAVNPSVVTISTKTVVKNRQLDPFREFFGDDFYRRFFGFPREDEFVQRGLGSGVIVRADGVILTNNHVVQNADDIVIALMDGRELEATVKGTDSRTDLAVLTIDARDLPAIKIGNSDELRVGQWVLAIGSPLNPELAHSVTAGIVSAKGRSGVGLSSQYQDYIQTDAAINPGNSGGPLVNLKGELVGINTAIATRTGGNMGIGFAIPSKLAEKVMTDILEKGRVVRGWLGVGIQNVSADLAKSFGLEKAEGVIISQVMENSPAEKAGLKVEDVIVALNGEKIRNVNQLSTRIGSMNPGSKAELKVLRNGKERTVSVIIEEFPEEEPVARAEKKSMENLGFEVADITPALQQQYNLEEEKGVVVTNIQPGSIGQRAGLREGDLILKVNRKEINSVADFNRILEDVKPGQPIALYLKRGDQKLFVAFDVPLN